MLAACSTDEIDVFDSHNYLSFASPKASYTFAFENDGVKSVDYNLPVVYAGRYNDHDVTFTIEALPDKSTAVEGTHYRMNGPSGQIIPANTNKGNAVIELLRTADMKDDSKILTLVVRPDDNFLPGDVDTVRVSITDRIIKPDWWIYSPHNMYLGSYTELKLRLFLEFTGVTDGTDPFDTERYIRWADRGTGNFIYKEFKDWEVKATVVEFRQWLRSIKGNPTEENGTPVAESLGNF